MKKIAIIAAVAVAASTSFASISINWNTYGFLSGKDSSKYASQDGVKLVWDLIYTTVSSLDDASWKSPELNKATGEISYGSTDTWLSRREWNSGSSDMAVTDNTDAIPTDVASGAITWDADGGCVGKGTTTYKNYIDETMTSGGIYAAVYQYMADGTVYYDITDLNTGINWANTPTGKSDKVTFGDGKSDYRISKTLGQVTQVPEPATMSLLGLGALAMVIRRKLRK